MFSVSVDTVINRPVEDVFAFIADAENDPQWCPSVKEIKRIAGDKPGPGARYRMRHEPGGMKFDAIVETTHYQPPEKIEWSMTDSGHELRIVYELESADGSTVTRLRQTSHVQTRGWLRIPGFVMQRFIQKDMQKEMNKQFQNLKRVLERAVSSSPAQRP